MLCTKRAAAPTGAQNGNPAFRLPNTNSKEKPPNCSSVRFAATRGEQVAYRKDIPTSPPPPPVQISLFANLLDEELRANFTFRLKFARKRANTDTVGRKKRRTQCWFHEPDLVVFFRPLPFLFVRVHKKVLLVGFVLSIRILCFNI